MADFSETSEFITVPILMTTDRAMGAVSSEAVAAQEAREMNRQAKALTRRTQRLRQRMPAHARNTAVTGPLTDGIPSWATVSGTDLEIDCSVGGSMLLAFANGADGDGAVDIIKSYAGTQTIDLSGAVTEAYFLFVVNDTTPTFVALSADSVLRPYIIDTRTPATTGSDGFWFNPATGKMYREDIVLGWLPTPAIFMGWCYSDGAGLDFIPINYGCNPFDGLVKFKRSLSSTDVLALDSTDAFEVAPSWYEQGQDIVSCDWRLQYNGTAYAAGSNLELKSAGGAVLHTLGAGFLTAVGAKQATTYTEGGNWVTHTRKTVLRVASTQFTTGDGSLDLYLTMRWNPKY